MLAMRHAPYDPPSVRSALDRQRRAGTQIPHDQPQHSDRRGPCRRAARPTTPRNAAMLNFCNGFAQGVVQTESQNPGGSKICFPKPAPKRSETMAEYAKWVSADAARKTDVASVSLIRFMSERYPCKG